MAARNSGQIWFFHTGVYSGPLQATPGDVALVDVRCPLCGAEYATPIDRGVPRGEESAEESRSDAVPTLRDAEGRLARECPDHPHRFAV